MPKINRIRVTNIHYDEDKKQLPDILLDLQGRDSIFLLANGGGKTLLIQLALQTVLPNEAMSGRRISQLLHTKRFTGHVALEWILDRGDKTHYLCTGFTFTRGYDDERIRYFNYLFEYGEEAELTIATLPLIKLPHLFSIDREEPMSFQELKDYLREFNHVQVFQGEKKLYQERLKIYGILPEEWKRIRDTNGTEGGVDTFFERCRTTSQLLDNLLIPGAEGILFQDEARRKEIFKAFSQHRGMLLQIPIIKANLKDFQLIREHSHEVVSQVKALNELKEEYSHFLKKMVELLVTFSQEIEKERKREEELEGEKEKISFEIMELNYRLESYQVFLKNIEYLKATQILKEKREAKDLEEEKNTSLKKEYREQKALYHYRFYEEARDELATCTNKLKYLDEKEPVLNEQLKKARGLGLPLWEQEKRELKKEEEELQRRIKDFQSRASLLEKDLVKMGEQENELRQEKYTIDCWFQDYQKIKKGLARRKVPLTLLNTPKEGCALYQGEILALEKEKESHQLDLKVIEDDREDLGEKRVEIRSKEVTLKRDQEDLLKEMEEFQDRLDTVKSHLIHLSKPVQFVVKDIFKEKEEIQERLWRELEKIRETRVIKQGEMDAIEERWALIERRNYYVPHHILLTMKRGFEERGIYSVLGSEWLAAQDMDEREKKAFLKENPLLPYAILLEEDQMPAVERILKRMQGLTRDFPLLFIMKRDLMQSEEERGDVLFIGNHILYQPISWEVFASSEKFFHLKEKMAEDREEKRKEVYLFRKKEEELHKVRELVLSFYSDYSQQGLVNWQEKEKEQKKEITLLQEEGDQIQEERKALYEKGKGLKEDMEKTRVLMEAKRALLADLKAYTSLFHLYPQKSERLEEIQRALSHLQEERKKKREERERIGKEKTNLENACKGIYERLEIHEDDFHKLGLDMANALSGGESYQVISARIRAIQNSLSERREGRSSLEHQLQILKKELQRQKGEIEETGIDGDWLKKNQTLVTLKEVKEIQKRQSEQEVLFQEISRVYHQFEGVVQTLASSRDDLGKQVQESFQRPPYLDYSPSNHQDEYQAMKEEKTNLEDEKKACVEKINQSKSWRVENEQALQILEFFFSREEKGYQERVLALESPPEDPRKAVERIRDEGESRKREIQAQKRRVTGQFHEYINHLNQTSNSQVRQFKGKIESMMKEERLYDYSFVQARFSKIMEGFDYYYHHYLETLKESQKNMEILAQRCLTRAMTIYENIVDIPKNSRIRISKQDLQIIRIQWPVLSPQEGKKEIFSYLEKVLSDLQEWKEEGREDEEIDGRMEEMIRSRNLIEVIAPIKDCQIRVYKPRKESMMNNFRPHYSPWEEVNRWSGGEEYSIYVSMFMIIISHTREQLEGRPNIWKVIMADNPFGRASSSHILEIVFQIAKANQIQLLSFTAHKEEEILRHFPVVYSLRLQSAYGREVMAAQKMETGFYLEPL